MDRADVLRKLGRALKVFAQGTAAMLILAAFAYFFTGFLGHGSCRTEWTSEVLPDGLFNLMQSNPELPLVIAPFDRAEPAHRLRCRVGQVMELTEGGERHLFLSRQEFEQWLEARGIDSLTKQEARKYEALWERCIIIEPD